MSGESVHEMKSSEEGDTTPVEAKSVNGAAADAVPGPETVIPRPTPDRIREAFETGEYPYEKKMSRRSYERQKAKLQAELLKVQLWAQ